MAHVEDLWTRPGPAGRRVRTDRWGVGMRWAVAWSEPDGRRRRRSFPSRDAAAAYRTQVDGDLRTGSYVSQSAGRATVDTLWDEWWARRGGCTPATRQGYEIVWRVHIRPAWGDVAVADVAGPAVVDWLAGLTSHRGTTAGVPLSASQRRQILLMLRGLLDVAVARRLIAGNPCRDVPQPRPVRAPRRYLTPGQVLDLAAAFGDRPGAVEVQLMATAGLRRGELFALHIGDLDRRRSRLWVRRGHTWTAAGRHVGSTKSHREREVPVMPRLVDLLPAVGPADALMFPGPTGQGWTPDGWRVRFDSAAARAGLPGLRTHELRHTAASLAITAGADVKAVQRMLGHASAAMTLDVYGHLFDERLDDVADAMSAAFNSADSTPGTHGLPPHTA